MGVPQTKAENGLPSPMQTLGVCDTVRAHESPLTPWDSVHGLCWERGQGHTLHLRTHPIYINWGRVASSSPKSWAAGSWPTRPAVCSIRVALPPWLRPAPPASQQVHLPSVSGIGSCLRGFVDLEAKGSPQTSQPTTKNGRDQ